MDNWAIALLASLVVMNTILATDAAIGRREFSVFFNGLAASFCLFVLVDELLMSRL